MKLQYIILLIIVSVFYSCDDMNDLHEKYLQGETIYLGKPINFKIEPGKYRAKVKFWHSADPKVSKSIVKYNFGKDSIVINHDIFTRMDSVEQIIDNLEEETYVFEIYNSNNEGNLKSLVLEKSINIYGNKYESFLVNRSYKTTRLEDKLIVNWSNPSENSLYTILEYTNVSDQIVKLRVENSEDKTEVTDHKLGTEIKVSSFYKPVVSAIDDFGSPKDSKMIDKYYIHFSNLSTHVLTNDTPGTSWGGSISKLFNGTAGGGDYYHTRDSDGDTEKHCFTIDLGGLYKLSDLITYTRGSYLEYTWKQFEVWGAETVSDVATSPEDAGFSADMTSAGWKLLKLTDPLTSHNYSSQNYTLDSDVYVRYIRFRVLSNFNESSINTHMSEISFYAKDKKE